MTREDSARDSPAGTHFASNAMTEQLTVGRAALRVLVAFVLTFVIARCVVYLIMTDAIPDLYLYVGGTHVHHLNYGIFLLSGVGAFLIFARPSGRALSIAAIVYGIGLGLTFDEFGMWLHLGGGYWQQASYDAVTVVAALLGIVAAVPSLGRFRPRHWGGALVLLAAAVVFATLAFRAYRAAESRILPRLERLDQADAAAGR